MRGHDRAQCIVHLGRLLVQLAHFGRQRLDLGGLGDVVRLLPRSIAMVAQGAQLLNVVGILSKAGRLEDDSAAPLQVAAAAVDSKSGELQDLLGSAPLISGNGPSHGILYRGLQQTRQRRSVGTESHERSLRLLGMSATCGGSLGENFGDLGGRTAWAGRAQNSRVFRDAPRGLDLRLRRGGKALAAG